MPRLSKAIYRFIAIPIKIRVAFCRNRKANPHIHIESEGAQNSQNNIKKEVGKLTLPNLKTYYKTTVNKSVWYRCNDRHIGQ